MSRNPAQHGTSARSPSLSCAVVAGVRIGRSHHGNRLDGRAAEGRRAQQHQDLSTGTLHRAAGLTIAADAPVPGLPAAARDPARRLHPPGFPRTLAALPSTSSPRDYLGQTDQPDRDGGSSAAGFVSGRRRHRRLDRHRRHGCLVPIRRRSSTTRRPGHYLTGPILGFVLRPARAPVAARERRANRQRRVIRRPARAGKSTIAAALAARGCALITDDVLHVRRPPRAGWPSHSPRA